jgi:HK97 family phage major capsid protein
MTMTIQALREQRTTHAKSLRNLVDQHAGDKWRDEHQTQYDTLVANIDRLDLEIDRTQKTFDLEAQTHAALQHHADRHGISTDEAAHDQGQERAIFISWLRGGINSLTSDQQQFVARKTAQIRATMSTTTDSQGGYLVPTEVARQLIEAMAAFGGMRSVATVLSTGSGNPINYPTTDATSEEGEIVGENSPVTAADFALGIKTLGSFKYSSKSVAIPFELLQDAVIDLEAHVTQRLAQRIARITNKHFTVGVGTTTPTGVVTAATVGPTGAAATKIAYDELIDLEHSVDPAYREAGTCRFMFHDGTLKELKKLKDDQKRPLWLPGLAVREPDTILGYAYTVNQHMPVLAANAKAVLFGDFSKYIIRDVMAVSLFRMTDSKYTEKGQVGFLAFSRHDGNLADVGGAIKALKQAAT